MNTITANIKFAIIIVTPAVTGINLEIPTQNALNGSIPSAVLPQMEIPKTIRDTPINKNKMFFTENFFINSSFNLIPSTDLHKP